MLDELDGVDEVPVLLAGGGLVGLSTAMFLAQHGIASLAVEPLIGGSQLPRAAFFHMRTLELFRAAGIEDDVRRQSLKEFEAEGAIVMVETLAGRELAAIIPSLNEGVDALSPCRRLFVTQPGLEPILRARAHQVLRPQRALAPGLDVSHRGHDAARILSQTDERRAREHARAAVEVPGRRRR